MSVVFLDIFEKLVTPFWRTKGKESISSWATPENNEKVFEKPTFSAFQDTSLESYLTEIGMYIT
eukprot:Pgem_evm1s8817